MGDRVLNFSDLDGGLLVWGVASTDGTVRACRSKQDADIDAGLSGPIAVPVGAAGSSGHLTAVSPLTYYHPDHGWTYAAIGRSVDWVATARTTGGDRHPA